MYIKLLDNAKDIRKAFIDRFVVPWEEFQIQHKDWIIEMSKTNHLITADWYKKSFLWKKMNSHFLTVSFNEALAFLKEHSGPVFFITEKGNPSYCQLVDFTADIALFTIPDYFVIGYGLDCGEKYRNLPYIGVLKPEVYSN